MMRACQLFLSLALLCLCLSPATTTDTPASDKARRRMRIVVISDTHGGHEELGVLDGDVLIHCGDVEHLFRVDPRAVGKIDDWFGRQHFERIFVIGGNHDLGIEAMVRDGLSPLANATWLHDRAEVFKGIRFYGSSWVPMLDGHAFFADDDRLKRAWAQIPDDTDVLITHTPPAGILDVSSSGMRLGCAHLASRLAEISPRLHCFGHVHNSAGQRVVGTTTSLNASSVDSSFRIAHALILIDLAP